MIKPPHLPLGLLLGALLTACGGGGPNNNPGAPATEQAPTTEQAPAIEQPSPPATLTGRFMDSAVSGLRYVTPSQSGFTNDAGEFPYLAGETVSFYVGDILIGEAAASETITPFDLAGIAPPVTSREIRRVIAQIQDSERATPFERAANIAAFLQTLDADGDPSNGQQIPTELHTLGAGLKINFMQDYKSFSDNQAFRKIITAGRSAGLWNGSRAIKHPLSALDTLYSNLGLRPAIDAASTRAWDDNGDLGDDGRAILRYDVRGNITLVATDIGVDGTVDFYNLYTYNANDQILTDTSDGTAATAEHRYVNYYSYDANGYAVMAEEDSDLDGVTDKRTTYKHTASGYPTLIEFDLNADGTIDKRVVMAYDDNGNLIRIENDDDADGINNYLTTIGYDDDGNWVIIESDFDGNGSVDIHATAAYDPQGNQVASNYDNDADGNIDLSFIFKYDTNGRLTSTKRIDGSLNLASLVIYTYNAADKLIRIENDRDNDGKWESREDYSYDISGNLLMQEYDDGADGLRTL